MLKNTARALIAIIIAGMSALAIPASAQEAVVISQGDVVSNNRDGSCTVGYINHDTRQAYIAAHCTHPDRQYYKDGHYIGYTHDSQLPEIGENGTVYTTPFDFARIDLADNVILGGNPYSGDTVTNTIYDGDQVCSYGATAGVMCGTIDSHNGYELYSHDIHRIPGDSGGPLWNDRGFIGVVSGRLDGGSSFVKWSGEPTPNPAPAPQPALSPVDQVLTSSENALRSIKLPALPTVVLSHQVPLSS